MTDDKLATPPEASADASLANALEDSLRKDKARKFRKGDRVQGRVFKITDAMAFVELAGKAEGMLDLTDLRKSDGSIDLEEGQEIEGIVVDVAANGVLLKRALISVSESVQQIKAAQEAGITVPAKVTAINKGGLELDLFGLRAFCPGSQFDVRKIDDFSPFLGETFQFRITEVSADGKRLVLSRRALLQEDSEKRHAEIRATLTPGAIVKGKIVRLQPFGAFVDFGGVEGLIHVTELTRARIHDPAEVVKAGQEVEVQVLKIEDTTDKNGKKLERIALSLKALEKDPWEGLAARFPVGARVPGKIVRLQPFGAFIEVAPGIDGLAHISTLADKRIEHPRDAVKEGDAVEAWVLAVEPEKKRLSLSLKEPKKQEPRAPRAERPAGDRPDRGPGGEAKIRRHQPGDAARLQSGGRPAAAPGDRRPPRGDRPPRAERPAGAEGGDPKSQFPVGSVHDGTVEKVEPFGVFVALPGGGRALVPNNELGVNKNADQKLDYRKIFPAGTPLRIAITEHRRGELKASKVEAERADERALVREWSKSQAQPSAGKSGFGTMADLFKKLNVSK